MGTLDAIRSQVDVLRAELTEAATTEGTDLLSSPLGQLREIDAQLAALRDEMQADIGDDIPSLGEGKPAADESNNANDPTVNLPAIVDMTGTLQRDTRIDYPIRQVDNISHIVIHHSAAMMPAVGRNESAMVQQLAIDALRRQLPAIEFHFVIGYNGTIYITQKVDRATPHTRGLDSRSIGVCLLGDYAQHHVTEVQQYAIIGIARQIATQVGRSVMLVAHSDIVPGPCPGANGIAAVRNIQSLGLDGITGDNGPGVLLGEIDTLVELLLKMRQRISGA